MSAVTLVCIACRAADDGAPVSHPIKQGQCSRCGREWPEARAWGRTISVVHEAEDAAPSLKEAVDAMADMAALAEAWQTSFRQGSTLPDGADATVVGALWTWVSAHVGRYAQPPVSQPDLGWVTAFLGALDDLPDGPVLLLGGAVGGEALALPNPWTAPGPQQRDVVLLESHPYLIAAAAHLTSETPHLGCLRRPGVVELRPIVMNEEPRRALGHTQLVFGDVHDPPFAASQFAAIIALNVMDSVRDPWLVMGQCEALLRPGGALLMSAPWNFRPEITAPNRWLDTGLPADCDLPWLLAGRLTGAALPGILDGLALQHIERDLPWPLRVHDRLTWQYTVDALLLRRLQTVPHA